MFHALTNPRHCRLGPMHSMNWKTSKVLQVPQACNKSSSRTHSTMQESTHQVVHSFFSTEVNLSLTSGTAQVLPQNSVPRPLHLRARVGLLPTLLQGRQEVPVHVADDLVLCHPNLVLGHLNDQQGSGTCANSKGNARLKNLVRKEPASAEVSVSWVEHTDERSNAGTGSNMCRTGPVEREVSCNQEPWHDAAHFLLAHGALEEHRDHHLSSTKVTN